MQFNTIQSPEHTEPEDDMKMEDIKEEDNNHNIFKTETNDLIRIEENYLTQGNNEKIEDPQLTQESTQETSSRQEDPVETGQTDRGSDYEQSQETSINDTP